MKSCSRAILKTFRFEKSAKNVKNGSENGRKKTF